MILNGCESAFRSIFFEKIIDQNTNTVQKFKMYNMKIVNCLIFIGTISLVGCSPNEKVKSSNAEDALSVQTEKIRRYSGVIESSYSGVVEAQKTTALSFSTMGMVTDVLVEEGQTVKKGQLLAKIDSYSASNAYQMAWVNQQQAEDAYRRMKPMKDNGTLPEIKWVEIETGLAKAKSAVALAKKNLHDCNLYSPVNGVIGKKNIQPGMNVLPGSTALEILNIATVYIKIPVPENEINNYKKGDGAVVMIEAAQKNTTGIIKEIGVTADILSHTYPLLIEVQNIDGLIKPGMIGSVNISNQMNQSGFLISNKALQKDISGEQIVFVVKEGKAQKIRVKTIALIKNKVVVQGNLDEYTSVIVSGQQKLNSNSLIKKIN